MDMSESHGPWAPIVGAAPHLMIPLETAISHNHWAGSFTQSSEHYRNIATVSAMDPQDNFTVTELRLSYRYIKTHPWVVTAVNGFLSAYFMEQPSFRVQRHFDELESGTHVWVCEVPATMEMAHLVRRLKADIPPFHQTVTSSTSDVHSHYLIDCPDPA